MDQILQRRPHRPLRNPRQHPIASSSNACMRSRAYGIPGPSNTARITTFTASGSPLRYFTSRMSRRRSHASACCSVWINGNVIFRSLMSTPVGFPVRSPSPRSSKSSWIWKAKPTNSPNRRIRSTPSASAPAAAAPHAQHAAISEAVFLRMMSK